MVVRLCVPAEYLGPLSPDEDEKTRLHTILTHAVMCGGIKDIRDIGRRPREKRPLRMPDGTTLMVTPGRGRYPSPLAAIAGKGKPYLVEWTDGEPRLVDNPDYKPSKSNAGGSG